MLLFSNQNRGSDQGVEKVHPMNVGGKWQFDFGRVKAVNAIHSSSMPDGTYGGSAMGFVVECAEGNFYYAGDTALTYDMKLIGDLENLDVALLPIGDNFTMGPDDALYAVKLLRPKVVIPMHYSTWGLIEQDVQAFAKRVEADTQVKCVILNSGARYTL